MGNIIDIHVHFGAPSNPYNKCYWSKKFESQPAYLFLKLTSGSLFKKLTYPDIEKKLINAVTGSEEVDNCVLLAMDKVYDLKGKEHDELTHLYVPNSFIADLSKKYDRILFGASVHPYRNDWKEELEYCIQNGAVLCKWIPSSQQINLTNERCFPVYDFLAEHNLPLLVHSGPEYSIPTSDERYIEYNNPRYLRHALERGVTVIVAHCALPYFGELDTKYLDDMDEFYKLFDESKDKPWKLYSDLSALAEPLRNIYVPEIQKRIPQNRLLFGSDYPLPASELSYKRNKNIFKWIRAAFNAFSIKNPIDKNYYVIKKMGFDKKIFTNAAELFDQIIRS
jgi:uncharacterized protein